MEHEEKHHESQEQSELTTHQRKNKSHAKTIVIAVIIILVIIIGGLAWLYTGQLSSAKEKVFKSIPLPAAIIDTKFLSASSVIERVALSKTLLEGQGLGDQADDDQTYDQLIDTKKLEAVAGKKKVVATQAEIDEEYQNIITQYAQGDEEAFKAELTKTYEMNPDEFKKEVIRQQVLQANLLLWYGRQEDLNKPSYDLAKDLQGKLSSGQSFEDVAKNYTQDEATKDFAGDSGMIAYDDLLPEFREALKDSKPGDLLLTPSRYGLHILKVLDLNNDGENGAKQIHLQQLFVKQDGFAEWLTKETDNINVVKLLKLS